MNDPKHHLWNDPTVPCDPIADIKRAIERSVPYVEWTRNQAVPGGVIIGCMADEPTTKLSAPHVATFPDGTTVALPSGTVLREGNGSPEPMRFFDLARALRNAFALMEIAVRHDEHMHGVGAVQSAWDGLKAEMLAQEKINAPVRTKSGK